MGVVQCCMYISWCDSRSAYVALIRTRKVRGRMEQNLHELLKAHMKALDFLRSKKLVARKHFCSTYFANFTRKLDTLSKSEM